MEQCQTDLAPERRLRPDLRARFEAEHRELSARVRGRYTGLLPESVDEIISRIVRLKLRLES